MTTSQASYLTTLEVARQLGMAVRSVQLMVDRGELEAWKTSGGHRRISPQSLQAWIRAHQAPPAPGGAPTARTSLSDETADGASDRRAAGVSDRTTDRTAVRPTDRAPDSVASGATARSADRAPGGAHPAHGAGSVLLIEDSRHYQTLVSLLLKQRFPGLDLHIADDGFAGLVMAGQLRPDVLLIDLLLPGIDGGALITRMRSMETFMYSSIVVVTSLDDDERQPFAYALSQVTVVDKRRLVEDLPAAIEQALTAAVRARALAPPRTVRGELA